jgi:pimeloyl-ACP methyl ester carboxylesterase
MTADNRSNAISSFPPLFGVRRELKCPPLERIDFAAADGAGLCLHHTSGGGRGPVILSPGTAMTALSYCLDTVPCNLAEFLVAKGFDLWLFDWRTSPLLAAHEQPYTLDDVARYDWPAAVSEVRRQTGKDQVAVMAHCLSSPCFMLSLVRGYLDREHVSTFVASQVGLNLTMTPVGKLKLQTRLDRLLPGGEMMHQKPSHLSGQMSDLAISVLARLLPKSYSCDNRACYRHSASFGDLIQHSRVNPATHAMMGELIPECLTGFLKDVAVWGRKDNVLADEDRGHLSRLQLPIQLISGGENRMFVPKSTELTYEMLCEANGPANYKRTVYDGFGHLDCFVGDDACEAIWPDIAAALGGLKPEALRIQQQVATKEGGELGITFRETMAGGFALDEADPAAGDEKGKRAGTILAMQATISIQDLDRFIDDPDHVGQLNGTIDYPPFGENIPSKGGVFNLFSPTDNPQLKLMVYEMAFEQGGQDYYLAGKKEVKNDPIFDLWKATTTLFTQLHRGSDKSGPVIGAGILTLGAADLVKMISTMRALNAASTTKAANAVMKFGSFFLGELWNTYCKKL